MVLSGGEKQRLGIARAIYKNASVIFADEPTASLDEANRNLVISLLRDCAKEASQLFLQRTMSALLKSVKRLLFSASEASHFHIFYVTSIRQILLSHGIQASLFAWVPFVISNKVYLVFNH